MKLQPFALGLAAALLLSSCSWVGKLTGGDKTDEYKGASSRVAKPLEVPPELTAPTMDDRYAIPDPRDQTTYSSYAQRTGQAGGAGGAASAGPEVLPKIQGAHFHERHGRDEREQRRGRHQGPRHASSAARGGR